MMNTCYTRHAWSRVHERLSLTAAEVAEILDAGLTVDIGREDGTDRVHRLFFSVPDQVCFVAVQDVANGVVITVLPIDFHENIAWRVAEHAQDQAKRLLMHGRSTGANPTPQTGALRAASDPAVFGVVRPPRPEQSSRTPVFRLTAYLDDARAVNLGSWPSIPYAGSMEQLLNDDYFFAQLENRLREKGVDPHRCTTVYVRLGTGEPVRVSLKIVHEQPGDAS